jgi:hypothetical protein
MRNLTMTPLEGVNIGLTLESPMIVIAATFPVNRRAMVERYIRRPAPLAAKLLIRRRVMNMAVDTPATRGLLI